MSVRELRVGSVVLALITGLLCTFASVTPAHAANANATGKVVDDAGAALAGARVCRYTWTPDEDGYTWWNGELCGVTSRTGTFSLSVPTGVSFMVAVEGNDDHRWASTSGDDWPDGPGSRGTFTAAAGASQVAVGTITAERLAKVSGLVVDADNRPVRDADVHLYVWDDYGFWEEYGGGGARTDANGRYTVSLLAGVKYTLSATVGGSTPREGWLGDVPRPADAAASPTAPGRGVTDSRVPNIKLQANSTAIVCTATAAGPGSAVDITLYAWDDDWWQARDSGTPGSDGCHTFALPLGYSSFTFQTESTVDYDSFGLDGLVGRLPDDNTAARGVRTLTTPGTDLDWGTITLRERNRATVCVAVEDGREVPATDINLWAWDEEESSWAMVDWDAPVSGCVRFDLPSGYPAFTFATDPLDDYGVGYLDGLTDLPSGHAAGDAGVRTQPATGGQDLGDWGTIVLKLLNKATVCVADETGPVSSTYINLYGWDGRSWSWEDEGSPDSAGCVTFSLPREFPYFTFDTDPTGRYDTGYLDDLDARPSNEKAARGVRSQDDTGGHVYGDWGTIHLTSAPGGVVTGKVVDGAGHAVEGADVCVLILEDGQSSTDDCVWTDAQGMFTTWVPLGATYTINADVWDDATGTELQGWHGNKGRPADSSTAGWSVASAGAIDLTREPIVLVPLVEITGTMVTPDGKPIQNCDAFPSVYTWSGAGWAIVDSGVACDQNTGKFSVWAPQGATATISLTPYDDEALAAQYRPGWLGGGRGRAAAPAGGSGDGTFVVGKLGAAVRNVGKVYLQPAAETAVTGRVLDGAAAPVAGATVVASSECVYSEDDSRCIPVPIATATTDAQGRYELKFALGSQWYWIHATTSGGAFGDVAGPKYDDPVADDLMLRIDATAFGNGGVWVDGDGDTWDEWALYLPLNTTIDLDEIYFDPDRDGYAFRGYNTRADGAGDPVTSATVARAPLTFYAQWVKQATVTYDAGAGSTPEPVTLDAGATVSPLPKSSRPGHTFAGWFTQPDGAGTPFTAATPVTEDVTVHAKWTVNRVTVTFDTGADGPEVGPVTVNEGARAGQLPADPAKDGFTFTGWNTAADGSGTAFGPSTVVTADLEVHAQWEPAVEGRVTVTFDGNGGTAPSPAKALTDAGKTVRLPSEPVRDGHKFVGWFPNADGSGEAFTADLDVGADQTVYAKWVEAPEVTVTFVGNGGSAPAAATVERGASLGEAYPADPTRSGGWVFLGWFANADGSGGAFTADLEVGADQTVYAKWAPVVTFVPNGPTGEPVTRPASSNSTVGELPDAPTWPKHTFEGWNTRANGRGASFDEETEVTAPLTVYAQWSVRVTFDSDGGSRVAAATLAQGDFLGWLRPATKAYNEFGGWFTERNGAGVEFTATTPVTEDVTVYAKWTSLTGTVTFDSDGGSAADPASVTVNRGAAVGTVPGAPTKAGNTFGGWFTERNGGGAEVTAASLVTVGAMTVYAKWTPVLVTVTFDGNGGSVRTASVQVAQGTALGSLPAKPTWSGHTFVGWDLQADGFGGAVTAATVIDVPITVYAQWTVGPVAPATNVKGSNTGGSVASASGGVAALLLALAALAVGLAGLAGRRRRVIR